MTAGVKTRVFPTMGKAVKTEGSQRAGQDLGRSGEVGEQARSSGEAGLWRTFLPG